MTTSIRSPLVRACASLVIALIASPADASDDAKRRSQELTWDVTVGDAPAGHESLKVVDSATGSRFISGVVAARGKKKPKTLTHQERLADGTLRKYRRVLKVRKGAGVFAFTRGEGVRIVPVNDSFDAINLTGGKDSVVWDPAALHMLYTWVAALPDGADSHDLAVVDVDARKLARATLARVGTANLGGPEGAVEAARWKVTGTGEGAELFIASGHGLVGMTRGDRKLLRRGWSWTPPPVAEPDASDDAVADVAEDATPRAAADGDAPAEPPAEEKPAPPKAEPSPESPQPKPAP